jgi:antitoxin (DNA-binding transcriptional repressor) of toxin-antitoxin stability system
LRSERRTSGVRHTNIEKQIPRGVYPYRARDDAGRSKTYHQRYGGAAHHRSDLARDVHGVIEKVRDGAEVVIEENGRRVVVIKAPPVKGRNISEVIAAMEASDTNATVDEDFARGVQAAVDAHREPLDMSLWD